MKKRYSYSVIFLLSLALLFVSGCAKKAVMKEESAPRETPAVAVQRPAAAEKAKDDAAARRRAEEERAARERALKAKTEKEAAAVKTEKEAAVKKTAKATFEFADIYFDFDKYSLNDEAKAVLAKGAEWLNKNKDILVTVEGHCDERGTAEYNLALGERRANAVAKYLIDLGVDAKRLKTISYGLERPVNPGHNEEAWTKNRRVHIVSGR